MQGQVLDLVLVVFCVVFIRIVLVKIIVAGRGVLQDAEAGAVCVEDELQVRLSHIWIGMHFYC